MNNNNYCNKLFQSYERMNLADALVPKYYQHNDCIINQGDPGDGMYFVEEGIVTVLVTSETGEQIKVCFSFNYIFMFDLLFHLYSGHRENVPCPHIQLNKLCGFIVKCLLFTTCID